MLRHIGTILLLVLAGAVGGQALPNPFPEKSVSTATLPNGMRVVVREDHSLPIVAINVVVRGGSGAEEDARGLSHYVEHMVFQGTKNYPKPLEPQYVMEQVGAISNATTSFDLTRFEAAATSEQADLMVRVLADITLNPLLTDEAFKHERPLILAEIAQNTDNPQATVTNEVNKLSYKHYPYRDLVTGALEDVLALKATDVRAFHNRWYVPNNMSIVLVGDISLKSATELATKYFGDAKPAELPNPPEIEIAGPGEAKTAKFPSTLQDTYLGLAFAAPPSSNFNAMVATDLLVTMLADGHDALLPQWWAKDGLRVTNFGGEFTSTHAPGRIIFWMQCAPVAVDKIRESTLALLDQVGLGNLPPAALRLAQQRLAAQFLRSNETYSAQASTLSYYEGLGGAQWACRYIQQLQECNIDRLRVAVPIYHIAQVTVGKTIDKGAGL